MSDRGHAPRASAGAECLTVLSMAELQRLWLAEVHQNRITLEQAKQIWARSRRGPRLAAQYAAVVDDLALAVRLVRDLGSAFAKVRFATYKGELHVIFKGFPGLRRILTGTRYKANNPKVVQMGVGRAGAVAAIRAGARLTVVLITAFRVFDYLMSDEQTLASLLGHLATDFLKIGGSAAAAVAAVGLVSGTFVSAIAVGPLAVAIVVGVGVGVALDMIDGRFRITDELVDRLGLAVGRARRTFGQTVDRFEDKAVEVARELSEAAIDLVLRETERFIRDRFPQLVWLRI